MTVWLSSIGLALIALSMASCTRASPSAPSDCRTFQPQPIGAKTTATPRAPKSGASWNLGRKFEHVVIVLFENQDYDMVMRDPYFRDVARRGALFTHYNALFHPSYPNYLALIGGKYFGTRGDDQLDIPGSERTIADHLEAKGLTWRQYAEAYPGDCFRGDAASGRLYRRKHVPFLSFDSIARNPSRCARVVPATQFDRNSLPSFAFFSPDMCDDGHDLCSTGIARARDNVRSAPGARFLGVVPPKVSQAAAWLRGFLEPILADPVVMKETLIVITFDESDSDDNNHIYTVFLGDMVKAGVQVDSCHDHYDVLRTIEDNFGIGTLGGEDAKSDPIVAGPWRE